MFYAFIVSAMLFQIICSREKLRTQVELKSDVRLPTLVLLLVDARSLLILKVLVLKKVVKIITQVCKALS